MGSVEADDERQIAVADDWQLQRLAHSSSTDIAAPCPGDIGGPSEQVCTRPAPGRRPAIHEQNLHRTFKLAARGAYIVTVRGSTSCRRSDRLTCLRMGATSTATRRFLLIPLIWRRSHASSTTQSRLAGQLTRTPQPTVRLLALIDIRSPQPAPRQAVN